MSLQNPDSLSDIATIAEFAKALDGLAPAQSYEEDTRNLADIYEMYKKVLRGGIKEKVNKEVLELLEKHSAWSTIFTTDQGSTYFMLPSHVALRFKPADTFRQLQPPSYNVGFLSEDQLQEFLQFCNEVSIEVNPRKEKPLSQIGGQYTQGNISCSTGESSSEFVISGISQTPVAGLIPLETLPVNMTRMGTQVVREEGVVKITTPLPPKLAYPPGFPDLPHRRFNFPDKWHNGHKVTTIKK